MWNSRKKKGAILLENLDEKDDKDSRKKAPSGWRNDLKLLKTLLPYLWPRGYPFLKLRVVTSLLCLILAKVFTVVTPLVFAGAIDALTGENETDRIYNPKGLIIGYAILRLASSAFGEFRDALFVKVGQHALRTSALTTFAHLHSLSLKFHLNRETGGVLRAVERGTKSVVNVLTFFLFNIGPIFLELALTLIVVLSIYSFWYSLIIIVTIILYVVDTLIVTEWRSKFRRDLNTAENSASNKAVDSLLNYETVKYFGNEDFEKERYDGALLAYQDASIKSVSSLAVLNISQATLIAGGCLALMLLSSSQVVKGEMTVGDFVLMNAYIFQLYAPLSFLGTSYRMIKMSLTDMENMYQLLEIEQDVQDAEDAEELELVPSEACIEFDNVVFSYSEKDNPVLKGLTFKVPAGKMCAIVGSTGAGKSTIARLLFRFYDIQSGKILINGSDIRNVTQKSLRANIAMVPQDTVLFNDTIGYNVKYGDVTCDDDEMKAACETAQILAFIEGLPKDFETTVGERGLRLSGGEKQRVSVARAVLKDAPICIFDEATSALDSRTESDLQEALAAVSASKTTLVIAHRLSTVVNADIIIVLKDGVVAEQGTHLELMALDGLYHQLYNQQVAEGAGPSGGGGSSEGGAEVGAGVSSS